MKIAVINGSPKGKYSITLQTVLYLERKYPDHQFCVLNARQKIKALEKDFSEAKALIEGSDAVLFSYPVYTFLAPSQLHRFIELMKQNNVETKDKFATQISTSKHFYDITAHKYIEENSLDMGMKYIRGLSADMEDLLNERGREDAEKFFDRFLWAVGENIYTVAPEDKKVFVGVPASSPEVESAKKDGKDVVIITDNTDPSSNLNAMIERFRKVFSYETRIVNISEYALAGGCLGCFRCAVSEKCVYKDGFDTFLRENIQKADAIVYAFTVSDHSMGARFKMYDDRQFCNGHRTVNMGMPVGYLVSGNYSCEHNLQTIIEGRAQVGHNFLAGVATDERNTDEQIDRMANTLCYALENNYVPPQNFYGVGGMKIFRDLIWLMQGMMKADHKFFKAHGQYDFPQKKRGRMIMMHAVGAMLGNEKIKSKMGNKMNEGMLMPYQKVLDACNKKEKR